MWPVPRSRCRCSAKLTACVAGGLGRSSSNSHAPQVLVPSVLSSCPPQSKALRGRPAPDVVGSVRPPACRAAASGAAESPCNKWWRVPSKSTSAGGFVGACRGPTEVPASSGGRGGGGADTAAADPAMRAGRSMSRSNNARPPCGASPGSDPMAEVVGAVPATAAVASTGGPRSGAGTAGGKSGESSDSGSAGPKRSGHVRNARRPMTCWVPSPSSLLLSQSSMKVFFTLTL
mmetsp:Transcript_22216/g.61552  ORF Transcript_22216/g.61552 Transcript_22216/m.61552 type:complete len:232 (+) Transcript_22216:913-1608(+)